MEARWGSKYVAMIVQHPESWRNQWKIFMKIFLYIYINLIIGHSKEVLNISIEFLNVWSCECGLTFVEILKYVYGNPIDEL